MKQQYEVKIAGYFYGTHYAIGAVLSLHPEQAKYELMLGNLAPHAPAVADPPAEVSVPRAAVAPSKPRAIRRVSESSDVG